MEKKHETLRKFGLKLRELRQAKRLSQETFASQCGLDRTYISGVERGVRNISLANISLIAAALDISIAELMEEV